MAEGDIRYFFAFDNNQIGHWHSSSWWKYCKTR